MPNPGIGERILSWLNSVWMWLTGVPLQPGETPASQLARRTFDANYREQLEKIRIEQGRDTWFTRFDQPGFGADFTTEIQKMLTDPDVNPVTYWLAKALFIGGGLTGAIAPWGRRWQYLVDQTAKSGRLDPATGFIAARRGDLDWETFRSDLADQGFDQTRISAIISALDRYLDASALLELWRRGEIAEADFDQHMQAQGYTAESIVRLKSLKDLIPGPQDLVRFALREAWRDDVAAHWGYDQDFVPQFQEWMEKQGYGGEWPKRFWRAHWELPSITLGMEMLHRRIITDSEFEELLRIGDIPAGWRDKIKAASHVPFTRVDARRMYDMGVLDENELYRAYRDIGYDHDKALQLVEFTIRYVEDADKELAKTDILDGYRKKLLSRDRAIDYLIRFGYRRENAEFYLAKEDLKEIQERKEEYLSSFKANYVEGVWDLTELSVALGRLNLPAVETARYIELWEIERERRIERPSATQVIGFFLDSIISEGQLRDELDKRGFLEVYIEWFVASAEETKRERLELETEAKNRELIVTTRTPSKAELRVWWLLGIIGEPELKERLKSAGYLAEDIEKFIDQWIKEEEERIKRETELEIEARQRAKKHPTRSDLKAFLRLEFITLEEMLAELLDQGFEPYWAEQIVAATILELEGVE